jgi:hypothetical protein
MVSRSYQNKEFIIWDLKNYECSETYEEDSIIDGLITTKNNKIITITSDQNVNIWHYNIK